MGSFEIKVHFIAQDKELTSDADPDVITEVLLGLTSSNRS